MPVVAKRSPVALRFRRGDQRPVVDRGGLQRWRLLELVDGVCHGDAFGQVNVGVPWLELPAHIDNTQPLAEHAPRDCLAVGQQQRRSVLEHLWRVRRGADPAVVDGLAVVGHLHSIAPQEFAMRSQPR